MKMKVWGASQVQVTELHKQSLDLAAPSHYPHPHVQDAEPPDSTPLQVGRSSSCSSERLSSCPWRGGAVSRDSPGGGARKRNLIPGGTETKEPCPRLKLQPHPQGYPPLHPGGLCLWALPDGSGGHTTGKEDLTDKEKESACPALPRSPKATRGPGLWRPQRPFGSASLKGASPLRQQ